MLCERQKQDRRAVSLYLTDKAEPLLEERNGIAEKTRALAFAGFNVAETKVLEEMLLRIKTIFVIHVMCLWRLV